MLISLKILEYLGRFAAVALPIGVIIGLLMPGLADFFKDFLLPTLFLPLTLSLICTSSKQIVWLFSNLKLLFGATAWVLLISPVLVRAVSYFFSVDETLILSIMFSSAAPPVTAAAAIALFLRLNSALAASVTILSLLLSPITLPFVLSYTIGINIEVSLWSFSFKLLAFIACSFITALIFRWRLGEQRITSHKLRLNGISVISIGLFTIGIMSGVSQVIEYRPWFIIECLLASSALVLGLYIITTTVFWQVGANSAMAIAIASGNCNLGLMYLFLAGKVEADVLIFFSIGQIPMYLLPTLLIPVVNLLRQEEKM